MVRYRKKRIYRRKSKRTYRRKRYSSRKSRMLGQKKYYYTRYGVSTQILSGSSTKYGSMTFSLDNLVDYTDFSALYDFYKINAVKVYFRRVAGIVRDNSIANAADLSTPRGYFAFDYDDNAPPVSLASIMQRQSCRIKTVNNSFSMYFKPTFLTQNYETTVSTGYSPKRGWISIGDANVPHYGIKWVVTAASPLNVNMVGWLVDIKYYLSFKSVK